MQSSCACMPSFDPHPPPPVNLYRPYSHKLLTINNYVNCPSNFAFARSIYLFHPPNFLMQIRSIEPHKLPPNTSLSLPSLAHILYIRNTVPTAWMHIYTTYTVGSLCARMLLYTQHRSMSILPESMEYERRRERRWRWRVLEGLSRTELLPTSMETGRPLGSSRFLFSQFRAGFLGGPAT